MPKKDILNNIFNKKIDCSEDKCTDSSSSQFTINSQFSAKETDMSDTQEANNFPILIPGAPCSPPQKVIINYGVDGGIIDAGNLIQGDNIILTGNTVGRLVGIGDVVIEAVIPPVDLSNYYTKTETDTLLLGKLDVGALDDYYTKTELQTPGGAIVDWSNIANTPDFTTDWGSITGDQSVVGNAGFSNTANYITLADLPELADVAYSGNYNDLINTPAIPDLTGYATEQWVLDMNYLTGVTWGIITGDQSVIGNAGFSNTANFITADDLPELAEVAYSGDYNDLINLPTIPDLTGYATQQWVIDQDYATEQWVLNQNYITGVAWDEITGTQTDIEVGGFSNTIGYITGVTWGDITGLQSVIGNAGFSNTANYITAADVPSQVQTDWNATSGLAQILNKPSLATVATTGDYNDLINQPSIPDLTGYATEAWVTSQGYLTSVPWSFNSNTGDLTINGIAGSLDGRWLERADGVITPGYGITVNGDLATGMGIELDTTVVDNRYLRKDVSDANGAFKLTLGELESGDAEFTGTVTLGSVATGTTNEVLLYGPSGVIQRKTLEFEGSFGVANSGGTKQFDVDLGTNLRFAGTGDTVVSFNSSTNTITINSVPGQGGGGVITSVFGRTTPAILAETGDYNTSQVTESGNLYFTQARVRSTPLTGYSVGSNAAISATDTILSAFGKTQGQINARVPTSRTISISGTSGNIAISGTPTQNLGSNAAWTINLATVGTAGANKTKVTTDAYGRVIGSAALTMGDLPSGVTQTLSVGTTPGEFSISGGNTVTLTRLGRSNIPDLSDFNVGQGFYPFYTTTGAVGYPAATGGGVLWNRNGTSGQFGGNFALWTASNDAETLYYSTGTSTGYSSWKTIADRAWVTSQIPTNFVTTNTNQSGLTGTKQWTGEHTFINSSATPMVTIGRDSNNLNAVIRYYGSTGGQIHAGMGSSNMFAVGPDFNISASGTRWFEVGASSIMVSSLSGTGTQMVVANASGVLSRQAIPAVNNGTLTLATGTGLSGSASFSANQSGSSSFTVAAASGYAIPTTSQISNWNAANNNYFSTTMTGANTLSSHTGNYNTISGAGAWIMGGSSSNAPPIANNPNFVLLNLYASSSSSPQIAFGVGGTGYNTNIWYRNRQTNAWKELADKSDIPTNYVTSNTGQSGLVGNKSWSATHKWGTTSIPTATNNSVDIGSGGANGMMLRITQLNSTNTSAILRGFATNGVQLELSEGGVNIPTGTTIDTIGYAIGGSTVLRGVTAGNTVLSSGAENGMVYIYPNGSGITTNRSIFSSTSTTIGTLTGTGTQMVTVNASGVLGRQAIPAVGVTSVSAGNGMNFTTITGTGAVTLGTPGSVTLSSTNAVTSTSHTHAFSPGGTTAQYIRGNGTLATFPTIPTVNNGTLTLATGNGLTGSATFTANQSSNTTFTVGITYGTGANTAAQGNDSRINNGQTAYGWGNHASEGYYNSSYLRARAAGSGSNAYDANNGDDPGGFVSSYSTTSWLANGVFNGYGGLITWRGASSGLKLQMQYDVGHGTSTGGRLAFRTSNSNTNNDSYTHWKEFYHTGNFATGSTSQYIRGNGSLATFPNIPQGTVTQVTIGNGLTGSNITSTGTITLGTPGSLNSTTTNSVTASSHTHALGNDVWGSTTAALSGNLNDYTIAGHRSQTTSANATLANNYPWEGGGGSLINSGGSGTYRTQIFHNRTGTQIAWRAKTSGSSWSTWKEFWHSSNFTPSNYTPTARTITLTGGTGITVSAGTQSLAANRTWTITNSSPNATHTGDVTGSTSLTIANNAVTTAKIINSAVTHAKYQNIATQRILGRGATGTGNVQELTLGANLSLSTAGVLSATNTVYTLPVATATVLGGIELFSNTVQSVAANSVTTTASRTYGIQLNSAGQAVVNVPWTNTTYSLMSAAELNTGTATTARSISAERLNTWLNSKNYFVTPSGTTSQYVRGNGTLATFPSIPQGTVTSVGIDTSDTTALTISGSPITSSGIISLGFKGTGSQYIKGDGTLATFPSIPTSISLVTAGDTTVGAVRYSNTLTEGQFSSWDGSILSLTGTPLLAYNGVFGVGSLGVNRNATVAGQISGRNYVITGISQTNVINMDYGLNILLDIVSGIANYALSNNSDGKQTKVLVRNAHSGVVYPTVIGATQIGLSTGIPPGRRGIIEVQNWGSITTYYIITD